MKQRVTSRNVNSYQWTGDEIKQARTKRGLTQRALADLLGVSVTAVSQWETNRTQPTWYHARDMKEILLGAGPMTSPGQALSQAEQISDLRADVDRLEGVVRSLIATLHTKFGEELADLPPDADE